MSAKKGDLTLFLPGADGWEVWNGSSVSGFELQTATDEMLALDVSAKFGTNVQMALPVRQIAAMPFRAQTDDLSLLGDLAAMHLEKNGARPALDGGQLTDHFVYGRAGEDTLLTAVVLNPPTEGQLPRKSPQAFDLSPRCLPLMENKVVVWRELGRWVFALGKPGQALYFQCLSGERLDERGGTDARLALTQFQIQGLLETQPDQVVIWSHGSASDARPEEVEAFSRGIGLPMTTLAKPSPTWPTPPSRLLPADVRAERADKKSKRNRVFAIAAAILAYLGVIGFLGYKLHKEQEASKVVQNKVKSLGTETQDLLDHQDKWDALAPVVESQYYPYEVLFRTYAALPNTKADRFIRLTEASFTNQFKVVDGAEQMERSIVLKGNSPDLKHIGDFNLKLKNSKDLEDFKWITQQPTNKDGWSFIYTAGVQN